MNLVIGEILLLAAIAVVAAVTALPRPFGQAVLAGALPFVLGAALLRTADATTSVWWTLTAANVVLFIAAFLVAQVLGSSRKVAAALTTDVAPAVEVLPGLAELHDEATALGFTPTPERVVWLGENQLVVLVHSDGTRAELIQHPQFPPGFSLCTEMGEHGRVVSVPWGHGLDDDRIRVPGASLIELLAHHRDEVSTRVARGATVVPARAGTCRPRPGRHARVRRRRVGADARASVAQRCAGRAPADALEATGWSLRAGRV